MMEKEMATHSSILAWRISWTEEPGGLTVHGVTRVRHDLATKPPPPPGHMNLEFGREVSSKDMNLGFGNI